MNPKERVAIGFLTGFSDYGSFGDSESPLQVMESTWNGMKVVLTLPGVVLLQLSMRGDLTPL